MKKLAQVKKARPSNLVGSDPVSQIRERLVLRAVPPEQQGNG
jgi:hypothetical protein